MEGELFGRGTLGRGESALSRVGDGVVGGVMICPNGDAEVDGELIADLGGNLFIPPGKLPT
ncbi:hypothetical protein BC829DRAFT_388690 [Chytridium lagenaria]|nr:hypothetical protein BC829DRAFT_388690 [Chytridium lagenaria]